MCIAVEPVIPENNQEQLVAEPAIISEPLIRLERSGAVGLLVRLMGSVSIEIPDELATLYSFDFASDSCSIATATTIVRKIVGINADITDIIRNITDNADNGNIQLNGSIYMWKNNHTIAIHIRRVAVICIDGNHFLTIFQSE